MEGALKGTTTPGQSGTGNNANEGLLHIPQKLQVWSLTIR